MIDFVLLLSAMAFAQVVGGLLTWSFFKHFSHSLKTITLIGILLMIIVSVLLVAEGLRSTFLVLVSALAGLIVSGMLNKMIPHKHNTEGERLSRLIFIAMCLHEFPEGIAFGSAYLVNPYLGVVTAFLIALHNIPEGSIVSIPFFAKKNFAGGFKAVLITQLLFILGGLSSYILLLNVPLQFQYLIMAFAAGIMFYIIIEELLYLK